MQDIDETESDNSSIEIKQEITKPKRKVNYVLTEKRKEAFEIARQKRAMNVELRKKEKQELEKQHKEKLQEKLIKKTQIINKKLSKKEKLIDEIISDDDEQPTRIKEKEPKTKIIYVNAPKKVIVPSYY